MPIEDLRMVDGNLMFTYVGGDEIYSLCDGCYFDDSGCSRNTDFVERRIAAKVHGHLPRVKNFRMEDKDKVNCGAGTDIALKLGRG